MKKALSQVFPKILFNILEDANKEGFESVVSWHANGKYFKVHDRDSFIDDVCPRYSKITAYKSFVRQLNLWGFNCIHGGRQCPERGCYYHPQFVRGRRDLLNHIVRTKLKGKPRKVGGHAELKNSKHKAGKASGERSDSSSSPTELVASSTCIEEVEFIDEDGNVGVQQQLVNNNGTLDFDPIDEDDFVSDDILELLEQPDENPSAPLVVATTTTVPSNNDDDDADLCEEDAPEPENQSRPNFTADYYISRQDSLRSLRSMGDDDYNHNAAAAGHSSSRSLPDEDLVRRSDTLLSQQVDHEGDHELYDWSKLQSDPEKDYVHNLNDKLTAAGDRQQVHPNHVSSSDTFDPIDVDFEGSFVCADDAQTTDRTAPVQSISVPKKHGRHARGKMLRNESGSCQSLADAPVPLHTRMESLQLSSDDFKWLDDSKSDLIGRRKFSWGGSGKSIYDIFGIGDDDDDNNDPNKPMLAAISERSSTVTSSSRTSSTLSSESPFRAENSQQVSACAV